MKKILLILSLLFVLISCKGQNNFFWSHNSANCTTVGSYCQGGILAYILVSGDPGYVAGEFHGIIAQATDLSSGIQWYNGSYTNTEAHGTIIGTGNANTNTIVASQGAGSYAAKICSDLSERGYSDWYLPSTNELLKLYDSRTTVGGYSSAIYWTSSESDNEFVGMVNFSDGTYGGYTKNSTLRVRAIRSF